MNYEFVKGIKTDYTKQHPWRAPGTARVDSPCGVLGGNPQGCPRGNPSHDGCPEGSWGRGPDARSVHFPNVVVTEWEKGSVVEAAWGIGANHGGGYTYRLCKRKPAGNLQLEEECFQKTPLEFVGDKQWVQFGDDESSRFEFKAERTNQGTTPAGSTWTKNPIPAYDCPTGGALGHAFDGIPANDKGCHKPQFPPPRHDLVGFGFHAQAGDKFALKFGIVDKLRVPDNIEAGDYVLSWRWDCEQTAQVWTTCASIQVTDSTGGGGAGGGSAPQPAPHPAPGGTCEMCRDGGTMAKNRRAGVHEGTPYSCSDAQVVLNRFVGQAKCDQLVKHWSPTCCTPAMHTCSICPDPSSLLAGRVAGYHKDGKQYTCKAAQEFLHGKGDEECDKLVGFWKNTCCPGGTSPMDYRKLAGTNDTFV